MNFIRQQQDYDNPNSLASKFRAARARYVKDLISETFQELGRCRILDLGGRPDYWRMIDRAFLEACKVEITTVNLEPQTAVNDPLFVQLTGDACALSFEDRAFDLSHSNSVIEHVGDWGQMERFATESRRVARRYYLQTPYYWFPVEPHFSAPFFHWLPEGVRAQKLMRKDHGFQSRTSDLGEAMRSVQHARLLDKAMMRYLFPDAEHLDERVLGLTKSLMAIRR